jgi:hypothetical protein
MNAHPSKDDREELAERIGMLVMFYQDHPIILLILHR